MPEEQLRSAAELEQLAPAERSQIVRDGTVTDLTQVPEAFLDRVRANVRDHIATSESAATSRR
jgi:hypothetical protein